MSKPKSLTEKFFSLVQKQERYNYLFTSILPAKIGIIMPRRKDTNLLRQRIPVTNEQRQKVRKARQENPHWT